MEGAGQGPGSGGQGQTRSGVLRGTAASLPPSLGAELRVPALAGGRAATHLSYGTWRAQKPTPKPHPQHNLRTPRPPLPFLLPTGPGLTAQVEDAAHLAVPPRRLRQAAAVSSARCESGPPERASNFLATGGTRMQAMWVGARSPRADSCFQASPATCHPSSHSLSLSSTQDPARRPWCPTPPPCPPPPPPPPPPTLRLTLAPMATAQSRL